MVQKPVRIGVAGLGFGADIHVPALQSLPDVDVVALAGRDVDKTRLRAEQLSVPVACGGVEALLDQELDAVSFALPPDQTYQAVRAAVERGIHVLCEKPLSNEVNQATALADLTRHKVVTAIDFQFAELDVFQTMKTHLIEKRFGPIRHAHCMWLTESWAQKNGLWSWKSDAAQGGGVLALLGSHTLYLVEWLMGAAVSLSAQSDDRVTRTFAPEGAEAAPELYHLRMSFADGGLFTAIIGNANPGMHRHLWHVVCDHGTLALDNPSKDYMRDFTLQLIGRDTVNQLIEPKTNMDGRLPAFLRLAHKFITAIQNNDLSGRTLPCFDRGARVQQLMAAMSQSAKQGGVTIPL